ncbi:hypothetical protein Tco_1321126 [Tanacetum coccineum]
MENLYPKHGLISRTYSKKRTIDQSAGGKLRDLNPEESWAILEDLALYDNESWNDPRDFAKPFKAITLPQDVPSTSDRPLIELENKVQCLMEAYLASTQLTQVNKITASCEICNGPHDTHNCMKGPEQACVDYDDMTGKINLLWKTVSKKLNDASPPKNAGNSMAPKSIAAISHDKKEELKKKGIKIPSKFSHRAHNISPPASIKELNKNPSSPKRVHLTIQSYLTQTDNGIRRTTLSSTNTCDLNPGGVVKGKEEVKEKDREEDEIETDMEVEEVIEEEESEFKTDEEVEEIFEEKEEDEDDENFNSFPTMKELSHHKWLLKNPRPPLYLMKRSLEVLRKFHWMILRGRFNQLSHVSSPLLSKPGEYYFAFARHLDELHVTWAHLEKKQTRLQTNTKTLEDFAHRAETASQAIHDAVTTQQVTVSHISRQRQPAPTQTHI